MEAKRNCSNGYLRYRFDVFSAAFGAARVEVGPGGVFEWHGNLYGTYTADEWNSMDSNARNEYAESIHWDGPSHEYVAASTSHSAHTYTANHSVADSVCQQQTPPERMMKKLQMWR